MNNPTYQMLRTAAAVLVLCPFLYSAPLLVSISGDTQTGPLNGVPREVNQISTTGGSAVDLFDLGDGSQGFLGGLAYRASDGLLYSIANDGLGNSTFVNFSAAGSGAASSPTTRTSSRRGSRRSSSESTRCCAAAV